MKDRTVSRIVVVAGSVVVLVGAATWAQAQIGGLVGGQIAATTLAATSSWVTAAISFV